MEKITHAMRWEHWKNDCRRIGKTDAAEDRGPLRRNSGGCDQRS